jgi:hypothetical protein
MLPRSTTPIFYPARKVLVANLLEVGKRGHRPQRLPRDILSKFHVSGCPTYLSASQIVLSGQEVAEGSIPLFFLCDLLKIQWGMVGYQTPVGVEPVQQNAGQTGVPPKLITANGDLDHFNSLALVANWQSSSLDCS